MKVASGLPVLVVYGIPTAGSVRLRPRMLTTSLLRIAVLSLRLASIGFRYTTLICLVNSVHGIRYVMTSFIDAIINRIKGPEGAGPGQPGQHGTQHHPETPLSQQRRMPAHVPSSVPPSSSAQTHVHGARLSWLPTATPASPPVRTPLDPYTPSGKNGVVFIPRRLAMDTTPGLDNDGDYTSVSGKVPMAEDRSMSVSRPTRRSSVYYTADAGDDVDTSHSSVEITVGPQSVPFAVARRPPGSGNDHLERIQERAISDDEDIHVAASHSHYQNTATGKVSGPEDAPLPVSSWRKEQLKYQKEARLSTETGPRPISAYHGPLSLPYARNPRCVPSSPTFRQY